MTNGKEKKDIDEYLKEIMGTFTEEEIREVSRLGLKNLVIKIPEEELK